MRLFCACVMMVGFVGCWLGHDYDSSCTSDEMCPDGLVCRPNPTAPDLHVCVWLETLEIGEDGGVVADFGATDSSEDSAIDDPTEPEDATELDTTVDTGGTGVEDLAEPEDSATDSADTTQDVTSDTGAADTAADTGLEDGTADTVGDTATPDTAAEDTAVEDLAEDTTMEDLAVDTTPARTNVAIRFAGTWNLGPYEATHARGVIDLDPTPWEFVSCTAEQGTIFCLPPSMSTDVEFTAAASPFVQGEAFLCLEVLVETIPTTEEAHAALSRFGGEVWDDAAHINDLYFYVQSVRPERCLD